VLEDDAQVFDFQLVKLGPRALRLYLGADPPAVTCAESALRAFLFDQGLKHVRVSTVCGGERPRAAPAAHARATSRPARHLRGMRDERHGAERADLERPGAPTSGSPLAPAQVQALRMAAFRAGCLHDGHGPFTRCF
jgi:hypothetical protein